MNYFYQKNDSNRLVVLFHGTGGNEYQLLQPLGEILKGADILSFEGNYGTGFSRRFFPPLVNGALDRPAFDKAVQDFITLYNEMNLIYDDITFIGYSNGANFIIGLMEQGLYMNHTVLLHPSNLNYDVSAASKGIHVIVTAGANDHMVSPGQVKQLELEFKSHFENVQFELFDGGHELTFEEVETIASKLNH
ncbi:alpha/beta hydrolase [Macrococcus armenti]|uniref:Dienelactone hydrolase family protein n=1 Tax=Macrococcus armenti TaxID=2875764 RepID=A0ABY3ZW84_9STAP|nr:dienelactone hydrolase family protein [Macrococcus armenti]UOB20604.1 dienelactone hydrolase family protein [Macrococcus armenti]